MVDSAAETAKSVQQLIIQQGLGNPQENGSRDFFVTDVPTRFEQIGAAFLGTSLGSVKQVTIG